jgi:hypothetical protein
MRPLTDRERFAPTQPLPECQELLREQRRWKRPAYTPNHVPLAARILYGMVTLTWVTWATIGLLSGHMFFLVSRAGPIHFSGVPAILFSFAVIASAAACAVAIVDHYDPRDNEESYKRVRRHLWYGAAFLLCLAGFAGFAEHAGLLPYSDGSLGLQSTRGLRSLLSSSWLSAKLAPHREAIDGWSLILFFWCFAGLAVLVKLGLLKDDGHPRPRVALFTILFLIGPAIAAFTLSLVVALASGSISARPLGEDALRTQIAWLHSMLLAGISMLVVIGFLGFVIFLRLVGILPDPHTSRQGGAV